MPTTLPGSAGHERNRFADSRFAETSPPRVRAEVFAFCLRSRDLPFAILRGLRKQHETRYRPSFTKIQRN